MLISLILACIASALLAEAKNHFTSTSRKEGAINLHFIPHTHDDTAWLKTTAEYSTGQNNSIQHAMVNDLITAVIKELTWNPDRKFIYVEQAFFQMWWNQADDKLKNQCKTLVSNGQLEFINGGWCMHDEANPTYVDMIDQTTLGHRFLLQEFGVTPKTTWQIDPFGHSTFQASMMSGPISGYNAVFFERADYQEIEQMGANGTSEVIWAPSKSLGMNGATYAGILYGGYCTISGLDMGLYSNDDPLQDNEDLPGYNVNNVLNVVIDALNKMMAEYPQGTNADGTYDFMLTLGCDFEYLTASTWFENTDRVISALNADGRVNAFYSTPSIYAAAKTQTGKKYTVKTDDFFPYADDPHSFWTGYFTSRQSLKGYIRESSAVFQAAKQLQLLTGGAPDDFSNNPLNELEQTMGLMQHHDTVAGTSKQHVTYDDARMLAAARATTDSLISTSLMRLTGSIDYYVPCDLSNASICEFMDENQGKLTSILLYNSLPQAVSHNVRVPVPFGGSKGITGYVVYDFDGVNVTSQIDPLSDTDTYLRTKYYDYKPSGSATTQWLSFVASLPPVGYSMYFISPIPQTDDDSGNVLLESQHSNEFTVNGAAAAVFTTSRLVHSGAVTRGSIRKSRQGAVRINNSTGTITNGLIQLTFNSGNNIVFEDLTAQLSVPMEYALQWYNASAGNNDESSQASGAYIFRPNSSTYFDIAGSSGPTISITNGPVMSEARLTYASWAEVVFRIWANTYEIEVEYTIGPIPFSDSLGREIISRFSTEFDTQATWFTDSNGRDSNTRIRNYRPNYVYNVTEPVAGNYYPVNTFIYMNDAKSGAQFNLMVDRSQAAGSMQDGEIEVLVQRRLQYDDSRGVGEPLNETGLNTEGDGISVRSKHILSIKATAAEGSFARRAVMNKLLNAPLKVYTTVDASTPQEWVKSHNATWTGISNPFPDNAHLLTAVSWGRKKLLLRVSHNFEVDDAPNMSSNVTVNLGGLFPSIQIKSCEEMTLTANQPLASAPKTTYSVINGPSVTLPVIYPTPNGPDFPVTVLPMEIRTFLCETEDQAFGNYGPVEFEKKKPVHKQPELHQLVVRPDA